MKKILSLISAIILFISYSAVAQAPIVKISDKIKLKGSEVLDEHILTTEDGYYLKAIKYSGGLFGRGKGEYFLQKYDKEFSNIFSNKFETSKEDIIAHDILNFKNNIVLIAKEENKKADYLAYSYVPLALDGKAGKPVPFGKFKYERKKDAPNTFHYRSQDSSLIAFFAYVDNNDDKDVMQAYVSISKSDLQPLWDKKISFKKPQEVIDIQSVSINNQGKVYIIYKEYEGKKAKESKDDRPAYKIKLLIIDEKSEASNQKEIILELKKDFLTSASSKVLPNGNIGIIGMYSATKKLYTNGVFSLKIDAETDSIFNVSKKEFSSEDLDILNDEDNTKRDKGEEGLTGNFKLIDISYLDDGSAYVTLEENYSYTVTNYNGRSWTYTTYYVSKDIIVIMVDGKGEIQTINTIPKRQRFAETTQYNSTIVVVNENGYHAIYNDDVDNLKKPIGEKKKYISSMKDCVAVMTSIDRNNKMKRISLFDKDDTRAVLMPQNSVKMNDYEIFFIALKSGFFSGTDRRIGTITLPH